MGNKVTLSAQHPPRHYDDLAEEVPLAIAVNGMALSVMMVSPFDFDDFITGHFLTEGIVKSVVEIKDIHIEPMSPGFEARVTVTGRREHEVKQRRYSLVSAGCGLCNKTAMDQAFPPNEMPTDRRPLAECDVSQLRSLFEANQTYNQKAGAMHAAMFVCAASNTVLCSEDIGRHNALDKVIGKALRAGLQPEKGYLAVTSRCGVELVQKASACGFTTLYCLSSPTTMAVDLAHQTGLNLVYVPRNNQPIMYDAKENYAE